MAPPERLTYQEWLELADEYYIAARALQWFSGVNYPTTYTGHHTLELYFKAILVAETGEYPNNQHDLKDLYGQAVGCRASIDHVNVNNAVDKYYNYDQPARYMTKGTPAKQRPTNNQMGSDSLHALDAAIVVLRDLTIETRKGLDIILSGESELTRHGFTDPHLALHQVILLHLNDSFALTGKDRRGGVQYRAPLFA